MGKPRMYLFNKRRDEEPIRGVAYTVEAGCKILTPDHVGKTVMLWSVYDFICLSSGHKTTDSYGRVIYKRLNEKMSGELDRCSLRLSVGERGQRSPVMPACELLRLMFAFRHEDMFRADKIACNLQTISEREESGSLMMGKAFIFDDE